MLVRIVKMEFEHEKIDRFLDQFDKNKSKIRNFEGCEFLELYRDKKNINQFFTYSFWQSEDHLEDYRNSELFKYVWSQTKPLFSSKPMAWSLDKVVSLD